jgi:hypothetical protein
MGVAEVYRGAVQALREKGWIKGELSNANGVCAIGAIQVSLDAGNSAGLMTYADTLDSYEYHLDSILSVMSNGKYLSITSFNDDYAESMDEIIAVMERASLADSSEIFEDIEDED